jgi:hypothetical protein
MVKPLDYDKFKALVKQVIESDPGGRGGYRLI